MLKSIIAAVFLTTAFTFVTVSAVSITADQALAKKKRPVGDKTAAWYLTQCMLNSDSKMSESKPSKTFIRCCSKSLGKCITCRNDGRGSCYVTSYRKIPKILLDKSASGTQLAPAEDKPKSKFPPIMGKAPKLPAANAPTKDKPKKRWPTNIGTFNKAPVKTAPAKNKPKKSRPPTTGTMIMAPMKKQKMAPLRPEEFLILKNAPTKNKPKTGPAIIKNRIQ